MNTHTCSLQAGPQASVELVDFTSAHADAVTALFCDVPRLYPDGDRWLRSRLRDASDGRARCTLVTRGGILAAGAIETFKSSGRVKLSTFLVDPRFRNASVGAYLLNRLGNRWAAEDVDEVYVTIADKVYPTARSTFERGGFTTTALERNRYGAERHEYVMAALPKISH